MVEGQGCLPALRRAQKASSGPCVLPLNIAASLLCRRLLSRCIRETAPSHHHCPFHLGWEHLPFPPLVSLKAFVVLQTRFFISLLVCIFLTLLFIVQANYLRNSIFNNFLHSFPPTPKLSNLHVLFSAKTFIILLFMLDL